MNRNWTDSRLTLNWTKIYHPDYTPTSPTQIQSTTITATMKRLSIILCILAGLLTTSCSSIRDITNALTAIQHMQFKLNNISNMRLAGVDVTKISDPSRLSIADGLALTGAFTRGALPATFTLNVDAKNPNNGTSKTRTAALTLQDFDWRLLIDDVRTVSGNLDRPIDVPGISAATTIPLAVSMDFAQFFKDKGYNGVLNLALALGGASGSTSRVKLDAQPTVGTPFGNLTYPSRITIVNTEFRGS